MANAHGSDSSPKQGVNSALKNEASTIIGIRDKELDIMLDSGSSVLLICGEAPTRL